MSPYSMTVRSGADVGSLDREIHLLPLSLGDSEFPDRILMDVKLMLESEGCLSGRD